MNLGPIFSNGWMTKLLALLGLDVEWGIHYLSGNLVANDSDNADLRWTTLEIGAIYRLTQSLSLSGGAAGITMTAEHNGVNILKTSADIDGGNTINGQIGESKIFEATATTLTFNISGMAPGTVRGNGTDQTFAQLEKLPFHKKTLV